LHWECQNLHDARPVARGSQCAVARRFFRNLHVWGTIVSDDSKGGAPKKLSTKDILAAARAQAAKGAGGGEAAPPAETPAPSPAAKTPAAKTPPPAKPAAGGKPKSTADILAAARAQAAGGAAPAASVESAPAPAAKAPAAAKPAAGGKPKSTADILAAARAAAGKGGAPAAESGAKAEAPAKPAVAGRAKVPAEVAASDGPKLSVQEMLAAVRPGAAVASAAGAVAAPEKPAGPPPMPPKPMPAPAKTPAPPPDTTRRNIVLAIFMSPFVLIANLLGTAYAAAWTMLAATTGIATLATARFMLPNVLTEPPSKFKIGPAADFDLGTVATRFVATNGVWIVHTDGYKGKNLIYALISVCTHLGCTPSWLEGERKFKCPCHGSGFYITGINFEGPAPRPLERAGIRLAEDGMLEVDKSVKFQEEMGQWSDPTSFYEVVG
jgi:cytochrome b6-f complex iron-sulfur subunit